jgi:hypothetical protein
VYVGKKKLLPIITFLLNLNLKSASHDISAVRHLNKKKVWMCHFYWTKLLVVILYQTPYVKRVRGMKIEKKLYGGGFLCCVAASNNFIVRITKKDFSLFFHSLWANESKSKFTNMKTKSYQVFHKIFGAFISITLRQISADL